MSLPSGKVRRSSNNVRGPSDKVRLPSNFVGLPIVFLGVDEFILSHSWNFYGSKLDTTDERRRAPMHTINAPSRPSEKVHSKSCPYESMGRPKYFLNHRSRMPIKRAGPDRTSVARRAARERHEHDYWPRFLPQDDNFL